MDPFSVSISCILIFETLTSELSSSCSMAFALFSAFSAGNKMSVKDRDFASEKSTKKKNIGLIFRNANEEIAKMHLISRNQKILPEFLFLRNCNALNLLLREY